jgi:aryl-alcohol dehydrogenase-like predicted oxidoreductase
MDAVAAPLITRRIPSTGEVLPVMGVGTNRFGRLKDAEAQALLARMHELGGTVIDTAAMYGESEVVIGRALKALKLRDKMFVATKFNEQSRAAGMESFERSLRRLETDHVDLLMIHFLGSVEPLMETMLELKKAGRTRYTGITTVSPDEHTRLVETMKKYPVDFVQVDYSLASRSSASDVFPVAVERKIATMIAVPFGGGRNSLFRQTAERPLPPWSAEIGVANWSQLFLKYIIGHPAVSCVIPGSANLAHLEANQAAGHGVVPGVEQLRRIEAYWDR